MKKLVLLAVAFIIYACGHEKKFDSFSKEMLNDFNPNTYELRNDNVKMVKGQILYMPIYSNIPHFMDSVKFDMSAFVTIHNTDFYNSIMVSKVQYFDSHGKLVHDFLVEKPRYLSPLETADFYVPYRDQSGIGANFLIEWKSDSLVTEPLVESVTINTKIHNCVAVLSQGKVIKESR